MGHLYNREVTKDEAFEAVETLDGLQPSWYRLILEEGPQGDEEYTLYGDDLGAVICAIATLKDYFGYEEETMESWNEKVNRDRNSRG